MGKLAVQKYFSFMILIITLLMMIFTLVGLYGGETNPSGNMARALLEDYPRLLSLTLRIDKQTPPIGLSAEAIGVEVTLSREAL